MIYAVADVHLGNHRRYGGVVEAGLNQRCRETLAVFQDAADRARKLHAPLVVFGDLFDSARPEPQVIAAAQQALRGLDAHVLLGNHEQVSTARGDHSLGPLDGYDLVTVYERPIVMSVGGADLLMVPFQPGRAEEWLPPVVESFGRASKNDPPRVLCIHLGIRDASTPVWLREAHDSVPVELLRGLADAFRIDVVMAGNWHQRQRWAFDRKDGGRVEIMQIGALVPTGWDNPGLRGYGTLASYDADAGVLDFEELPGPRFLKLRAGDDVPTAKGSRLYVQVTAPREHVAACEQHIAQAVEAGDFAAGEVVPDAEEIEQAARGAAAAARSEDTLDGALAAFVGEMDVPEGVVRSDVLARCRRYLAAGGEG